MHCPFERLIPEDVTATLKRCWFSSDPFCTISCGICFNIVHVVWTTCKFAQALVGPAKIKIENRVPRCSHFPSSQSHGSCLGNLRCRKGRLRFQDISTFHRLHRIVACHTQELRGIDVSCRESRPSSPKHPLRSRTLPPSI